ncbi:MAG: hypothetical protein WCH83_01550 [Alphaproteobacteria bacterium]
MVLRAILTILVLACFVVQAPAQSTALSLVNASSLNCRSGITLDARVVERLERGASVAVVATQGDWSMVQTAAAATCWVMSQFLSLPGAATPPLNANAASSPVRAAPARPVIRAPSAPAQAEALGVMSASTTGARRSVERRARSWAGSGACPCGSGQICTGPRGGRYCLTASGNRRYGFR